MRARCSCANKRNNSSERKRSKSLFYSGRARFTAGRPNCRRWWWSASKCSLAALRLLCFRLPFTPLHPLHTHYMHTPAIFYSLSFHCSVRNVSLCTSTAALALNLPRLLVHAVVVHISSLFFNLRFLPRRGLQPVAVCSVGCQHTGNTQTSTALTRPPFPM